MKRIFKNNLFIRNSLIFALGTSLASVGNYLFNIQAARALSVEDYGNFMSLLSIFLILAIPTGTIQTVITRFIARYQGKKDWERMHRLFFISTKAILAGSILFALIFYLLSPFLAKFIHVPPYLVALISFTFVLTFIPPINRGVLAGNSLFTRLAFNSILEVGTKVLAAFVVLYFGFGIKGLILALNLSLVAAYLVTLPPLRIIFRQAKKKVLVERQEIYDYIPPVLMTTLLMAILFNADLILAKHFFDPATAGQYAALATIGKIVFYLPAAISVVFFTTVAARQAKGQDSFPMLRQALILTGLSAGLIVLLYYLAPNLIIKLLFGLKYTHYSQYLAMYSLFIFFYGLANVLVYYSLSLHTHRRVLVFLIGAAVCSQITLMGFFHKDIRQLIQINLIVLAILSLSLFLVHPRVLLRRV